MLHWVWAYMYILLRLNATPEETWLNYEGYATCSFGSVRSILQLAGYLIAKADSSGLSVWGKSFTATLGLISTAWPHSLHIVAQTEFPLWMMSWIEWCHLLSLTLYAVCSSPLNRAVSPIRLPSYAGLWCWVAFGHSSHGLALALLNNGNELWDVFLIHVSYKCSIKSKVDYT